MDANELIRSLGTDAEAARRLGVHRSTISRIRRGISQPTKIFHALLELQAEALMAQRERRGKGRK